MDGTEEPALTSGAAAAELVPGSVSGILGLADAMASLGDGLDESATALSRVEVTGWYGAASAAAHDRLGQEPSRWVAASGAFSTAGEALRRYAAALAPARALAEQAVDAYRRYLALVDVLEIATVPSTGGGTPLPGSGQVATSVPDRAQLGHRAAVLLAAAHGDDSQLAYDADALRRQAISLLTSARSQALAAGDAAADAVQAAMADAPQARTFWQGTIRRPGAEDAGHATLDIAGFVPGWVGMGATMVNLAWYGLESDRENAAYSAMGLVGGPFSRVSKSLVGGSRVAEESAATRRTFLAAGWLRTPSQLSLFAGRMMGDKSAILSRGAHDLDGMARDFGLTKVSEQTFVSPGGLTYSPMRAGSSGESNRLTHTLLHGVPDPADPSHSVFNCGTNGIVALLDRAWSMPKYHDRPHDLDRWIIDMGRVVGTDGQTKIALIAWRRPDGALEVITAYPT